MEQQDNAILKDFEIESNGIIDVLIQILDRCEGNFYLVKSLEEYGQNVDRIMGGAQSIAITTEDVNHVIHKIADYAAVCKAVGYKASQITDNQSFFEICVGLLQDATEALADMVAVVADPGANVNTILTPQFIDRLRWVSQQFSADVRASVDVKKTDSGKMNQGDIDDLLKKLGF